MTTIPTATELEALCLDLATGAATIVRDARRSGMVTESKSTATDVVTDVDRASERWLTAQLAAKRPDDALLAEEGSAHRGTTGVRWIVDPIDGTVNFVLGLPQYAVSVAAEVHGVVVAGAVVNPVSGERFHAARGSGAHLTDANNEVHRLSGPREVPLERAVVATGFSYDAATRERQMAVAAPLLPRIGDLRRLGSAALDLCFLAAGRYDGYYEAALHPWDHAAGGLIAAEAGCLLSGLHGRPPSDELYAAAGAVLAPSLFTLLEELSADTVLQ